MRNIDILIIISIFIFSLFTLKDLAKPDFYTSHDGIHQVVRLFYFDKGLREGHFPPRWAAGLLNGFGYPLFIFSYHLPWFMTEPFLLAGFSIFSSIKLTFFLSFFLSGITMYFYLKQIFPRLASFTGTFLYLYAPFRFSNIFVRAAIGDALVYIFLPIAFLSLYKLKMKFGRSHKINSVAWIILGSLSIAAIILSHAMVAILLLIFIGLYILYSLIFLKHKKFFLQYTLILLLFAFGLAAYYFIPAYYERQFTNFHSIMNSVYKGKTFVPLKNLIYSRWGYGTMDAPEAPMSLQIGVSQWLAILLGTGVIIYLLVKQGLKIKNFFYAKDTIFFIIMFFISVYLMLSPSKIIWDGLSQLMFIDFTWRILPVVIFSAAAITGFVIKKIKFPTAIAFLLIFISIYTNRNHLRINQQLSWPLDFYLLLEKTTNSYDEYTPKWAKQEILKSKSSKIDLLGKNTDLIFNKTHYLEFKTEAIQDSTLRVNTLYYPGWTVFVDGDKTQINYESHGLIEFPLKKGNHHIVVKFTETPLRQYSNIITLLTLVILISLLFKFHFFKR